MSEIKKERRFVNIYQDKKGRFISGADYKSYEEAFENRDDLDTYVETVEIISPHDPSK